MVARIGWRQRSRRWARRASDALAAVGYVTVLAMMLIVTLDVAGRYLLNRPIIGSYEVVEYLMAVSVFVAYATGQIDGSHIRIDILVGKLSPRGRAVADTIAFFLMLLVLLAFVWGDFTQVIQVWNTNQISQVLFIPRWPFQLATAVALVVFCFVVLVDLIDAVAGVVGAERTE